MERRILGWITASCAMTKELLEKAKCRLQQLYNPLERNNLYEVQGDSFIAKVSQEEKRMGIFFWVKLGIEIWVHSGVTEGLMF